MAADINLTFSKEERAVLVELRTRLGLATNADLIRVALWMYAHGQGLNIPPSMFAVMGERVMRSTRNT